MNEKQAKWETREREREGEKGGEWQGGSIQITFRSILLGPSPFVCVCLSLYVCLSLFLFLQ